MVIIYIAFVPGAEVKRFDIYPLNIHWSHPLNNMTKRTGQKGDKCMLVSACYFSDQDEFLKTPPLNQLLAYLE